MSEPDRRDLATGYEHGDMSPTVVLLGAAVLLVALAIALIGVTVLEQRLTGVPAAISRPVDLTSGLQAPPAPTPPIPRLEAASGETLDPYRAFQQRKLSSYAWVDRSAGVVRIPIDRAMDVTADRGLPSRPAPNPPPRDDGASSPSMASSGRVEEAYP